MQIERQEHPQWLSNTYLVTDQGSAVFVDAGADVEPLLARAERDGLRVTHVLATHRHKDHVLNINKIVAATGAKVLAHAAEAISGVDQHLDHGDVIETGGLHIEVLHVPGHTQGHLALVVNGAAVFTGDMLFRGSIGGCAGPGHGTFAELRDSLMEVLMGLPPTMAVHPGHTHPTTIGQEWEHNPFIRVMRGLDSRAARPCTFATRPAELVLRAPDYDGGTKAWVTLPEVGDLVVPGSLVQEDESAP